MSFRHFFKFYRLRGGRTKGLRCRPFVNSRNQRKCPLDSSRSGDSALGPRTDSGLHAADRSEGTKFIQSELSRMSQVA